MICALACAAPSAAEAPFHSLRPQLRPSGNLALLTALHNALTAAPERLSVRPRLRPVLQDAPMVAATTALVSVFISPGSGVAASLRPVPRPAKLARLATRTKRVEPERARSSRSRRGSVCGDRDIRGTVVGRVPGKLKGCGASDAVRVTEVSGVKLSQAAVLTCDTARALKSWVDNGVQPAFRRLGPVVSMRVAAHYSCRTRNNRPGAKISEHGRAKAIDISAFNFADGEVVTVLHGWRESSTQKMLSKAHARACGPFGTVLGPKSDRYHQDHFHLDTARHRGGPYCK
jgi:hypothetical protein